MFTIVRRSLWFALVCGSLVTLSASPPVIGVAQSRGAFFVNNASVPGTATILDGTSVRTTTNSSDVSLKSGERVTLASSSSARVYQDRLVLEAGMAELNHLSAYHVETRNLRISASGTGAMVRVGLDSGNQVNVSAVVGTAEVRTPQGQLVARVFPGTALQVKAVGATTTSNLTGTVESKDGKFFLTDDTTKVKMELRGSNLKSLVGKHVKVTGSGASGETPAGDASQVVLVASATVVAAAVAGGAAGGAAAGAAVATGVSATTIIAVGGGIAAAATAGGLAAAGTFSGSSPTVSR